MSSACFLVGLTVAFVAGGERDPSRVSVQASQAAAIPTQAPYCGVNALYIALLLNGKDVAFTQLLRPEFFSSPFGSSVRDLSNAAESLGVHTIPLARLAVSDLYSISAPTILHVTRKAGVAEFDHFVLLVGREQDDFLVADGPAGIKRYSPPELASIWDGTGLVVSADEITAPSSSWIRVTMWLAAGIAVTTVSRRVGKFVELRSKVAMTRRFCVDGVGCLVLLAIAFGISVAYHTIIPDGMLASSRGVEQVRASHAAFFLPQIDADGLIALGGSVQLIDARKARDFVRGHIPRAISLPYVTPPAQVDHFVRTRLVPNMTTVVYCANPRCSYAEGVAETLVRHRFSSVMIYSGGWDDWSKRATKR